MSTEEEELDKIENMIQEQREKMSIIIEGLSKRLTDELKDMVELEATAIALRQKVMGDATSYALKYDRLAAKLRVIKKAKFEYYATMYQVKVNTTEKNLLIDADTSSHLAKMEMIDHYMQYLMESVKTLDHITWAIKNKINIHNQTGLD